MVLQRNINGITNQASSSSESSTTLRLGGKEEGRMRPNPSVIQSGSRLAMTKDSLPGKLLQELDNVDVRCQRAVPEQIVSSVSRISPKSPHLNLLSGKVAIGKSQR